MARDILRILSVANHTDTHLQNLGCIKKSIDKRVYYLQNTKTHKQTHRQTNKHNKGLMPV